MRPDLQECVLNHQATQVNSRASTPERNFEVGDSVMVSNYQPKHSTLQPGVIQMQIGMKSYHMDVLGETTAWRRHADQILKAPEETVWEQQDLEDREDELPVSGKVHASSSQGGWITSA